MNGLQRTAEAQDFIDSADRRETSKAIMEAIVRFAGSIEEAESIWENGLHEWDDLSKHHFVDTVTGNGQQGKPEDYCWGVSGSRWASEL